MAGQRLQQSVSCGRSRTSCPMRGAAPAISSPPLARLSLPARHHSRPAEHQLLQGGNQQQQRAAGGGPHCALGSCRPPAGLRRLLCKAVAGATPADARPLPAGPLLAPGPQVAQKRVQKKQQVVLTREVPGLGAEGALKAVPVGYWRNYLQPQGLAAFADAGILEQIRRQREEEERVRLEEKAKAQAMVSGGEAAGRGRSEGPDRRQGGIAPHGRRRACPSSSPRRPPRWPRLASLC